MVTFNSQNRSFTITMLGSAEDYFNYCRAIADLIASQDPDFYTRETNYYAASFLANMLPAEEQTITVE